ncbi:MAG TPA: carboxymuconolactone decarboxylase family protein [Planctomycetota bacterium]|nr:carboxymuconolactone decarboxylase family protein [Planctomycetota bacterium]
MTLTDAARHNHDELFPDHRSTRELLTFSMLAALGGCEPPLAGHVAANLAVGNHRQTLIDIATVLLPFIGYPRTLTALRIVDEGTFPMTYHLTPEPSNQEQEA